MNNELTRVIKLSDITPDQPFTTIIAATPAECAAMAKRFGLDSIQKLVVDLKIYARQGQPLIDLVGQIKADMMQICRVSNDAFPSVLTDKFTEVLTTNKALAEQLEAEEGDQSPELIEGELFDYGEVVAQWFGLCLDPYPRKAGAKIPDLYQGVEEELGDAPLTQSNPFAAMADVLKGVVKDKK